VTVNGNTASTVFTVNTGVANASLNGLIVTNGFSNTGGGGGGINNGGALTVTGSTISGNQVISSGGPAFGGGIFNSGTLTVLGSTISGNSVADSGSVALGGGIYSLSATLTVANSTISGNVAVGGGQGFGGGLLIGDNGTITLTNNTISGNITDGLGGGIYSSASNATLANNIISGNSAPSVPNFYGNSYTDNGGNLVGGVALAPLASNGGPTQTLLPLPGGTAICGGTVANAAGLSTDQRGLPRTTTYSSTACVDSGAVQTDYTSVQFNSGSYSGGVNAALNPAPVVSVLENGQNAGGIPLTLVFTGKGSASGLGPVTTVAGTGASFGSLEVNALDSSDSLSITLPITLAGSPVGATSLSASVPLAITKGTPAVIISNGGANNQPVGTNITFTVTVNGSGPPPTGTVYFYSLHSLIGQGPVSGGQATLQISTLPAGESQIEAHYLGDANYAQAYSNFLYQFVGKDSLSTTKFTATPSPVTVGHPLSLSFTGSGIGPTPTGTVQFLMDALIPLGSASMVAGTATLPLSTVPLGNHTFIAKYGGDQNYSGAQAITTGSVIKVVSQVTVSSSANPSVFNSSVTITASVTHDPDNPNATGTVNFFLLHTLAGTGTLVNGQASITLNNLALGDNQFEIQYLGDGNYTSNYAPFYYQLVSKMSLTTSFTATPDPVTVNHTLTLTFTGTNPNATPTGTVQFFMDALIPLGSGPLAGGVATLAITTVPLGNHTFIAKYAGDTNFQSTQASTAGSVVKVVSQVTLAGPSGAIQTNANATYNVTVTQDASNVPATGTVNLYSLHTLIGQGTLVNGQVSFTVSFAQVGDKEIVAQYLGDGTYSSGYSNFLYQNVN
jgi:hypothetical protein